MKIFNEPEMMGESESRRELQRRPEISPESGVEIWALWDGLELALKCNITKLIVDMDATVAIALILKEVTPTHPLSSVILDCRCLMDPFLEIQMRHMYREANQCADILVRQGVFSGYNCNIFYSPPIWFYAQLEADRRGDLYPRNICNSMI
ncbi:hypothetical protein L1049_002816 [Liquidambar formosana]|uniref:RNase H type-1 domain-containing protein n=1 Tax=Liquidambar formosana TaxID=63359 RepID=A0AAP0R952_LIQFO